MKNIALLVIDAQKVYSLNHSRLKINNVGSIIKNINKIIRYFENKNLPIIYIRHLHDPDGSDAGRMYDFSGKTSKIGFRKGSQEAEYIDDLIIIKGAPEIIKNRYNSFFNTALADLLNKLKIFQNHSIPEKVFLLIQYYPGLIILMLQPYPNPRLLL